MAMYQGRLTGELFTGVHPLDGFPLSYIFAQAAFDPSNYIRHKDDLASALVANFKGKVYDVSHKLYGFIGVV